MKVLLVKKACVLILAAQFNGIFWLTYDITQIKKVLEKKKSSYKWRSYQENQASFTIKRFTDIFAKLCSEWRGKILICLVIINCCQRFL